MRPLFKIIRAIFKILLPYNYTYNSNNSYAQSVYPSFVSPSLLLQQSSLQQSSHLIYTLLQAIFQDVLVARATTKNQRYRLTICASAIEIGEHIKHQDRPVYFHLNIVCIRQKWPSFLPNNLQISSEISNKLTPIHRDYLASFGR